jgi:nickel/cobalt exporter
VCTDRASCDRIERSSMKMLVAIAAVAGLLLSSTPSFAHPMGNFSISHYTGITIEHNSLEVRYFIDMAEIPTFQEMQQSGITAHPDNPHLPSYLATKSAEFARGLHVTLNGNPLALKPTAENVIFPPGAGNLPTMKFGFIYRAQVADACKDSACQLSYADSNFAARAGWKEIVIKAGRDVRVTISSAPDRDRSAELSDYPTDLVNSPLQSVQATATFSSVLMGKNDSPPQRAKSANTAPMSVRPTQTSGMKAATVSPVSAPLETIPASAQQQVEMKPNQQKTPRSYFTQLIATQNIGLGIALLAALIAAGLGALHALEPGHGKTIVAAYLIGTQGTGRHAVLLGTIVTVSHTAGVYLLGAVTLYAQKYILPEKLYPFLGVLSGILIAGMGFYLFLQRYVCGDLVHSHAHGVSHHYGGIFHSPAPEGNPPSEESRTAKTEQAAQPGKTTSARQLLVLGITGGIVPCPAALVVLLSALALHRVVFGLFLIVAFSVGLASVLIGMGMVAVYAGRMMSRLTTESPLVQRWLPLMSAAMITVLGCTIALRGLMTAGIVQIRV